MFHFMQSVENSRKFIKKKKKKNWRENKRTGGNQS